MKLHYFDGYGRAEPIRMLLAYKKVPFEDARYSFEEWGKLKVEKPDMFEFGQLPVLEKDGKKYSQSKAILKMLAMEHGLLPEDPQQAYLADSAIEGAEDIQNFFFRAFFTPEGEVKTKFMTELVEKQVPTFLEVLEKRLKQNSSQKTIVGNDITIADIRLAALGHSVLLKGAMADKLKPLVEKHPVVNEYFAHMGEVFKDYLAARPDRPF